MITTASKNGDGKEFVSHAPGYWYRDGGTLELWDDWKWQLKNRVTTLAQLEKHIELSQKEHSGVLLSGDKLALAMSALADGLVEYATLDPDLLDEEFCGEAFALLAGC